jgi:hypothetical protein
MMFFRSIYPQYLLETITFGCLMLVTLVPMMKRRDPRKVLAVLVGLNVLRFGGVAGALAAVAGSPRPAFLVQVAIGDGLAATFALVAFVLLLRRSDKAALAVAAMNVLGLAGIVVSESWLQYLEWAGYITRPGAFHGPTIGAALYTVLHLLVFCLLRRQHSNEKRSATRAPLHHQLMPDTGACGNPGGLPHSGHHDNA